MSSTTTDEIRSRMEAARKRIGQAAVSAGREPGDVRLVVVTKAQPLEAARAAIQAGAKILGENYPEEAVEKIEALREDVGVQWHMIGHLQSRKAKLVATHFAMLHSLDSLRLAEKLERLLAESGRRLPALLEFNVGEEESKYGWQAAHEEDWAQLAAEIEPILALPHLEVHGLMTMPPLSENPEDSRPYFVKLRRLRDFLAGRFPQSDWRELSMGTSADYPIAVQEGATYVRLGEAIVGPRNYNI